MIKVADLACPKCGAPVEANEKLPARFCTFCGASLQVYNENEYIVRHIDEARMRELDILERNKKEEEKFYREARAGDVKRHEQMMACDDEIRKIKNTSNAIMILFVIIIFVFLSFIEHFSDNAGAAVLMIWLGSMILCNEISRFRIRRLKRQREKLEEVQYVSNGYTRTPKELSSNVDKLHSELARAGFTNIETVNMRDLVLGIMTNKGQVESITVNGKELKEDEWLKRNSRIVIQYHGFR